MPLQSKKTPKTYNGYEVTRSSIRRLENEVKSLKRQVDEIIAQKIYSHSESQGPDSQALNEMRQTIESKEELILRLKLML
ncbi:unnamed protein product [Blepharisma stoltei]|uniref:Uncharacterized protein n=1 Tax=Blepharisma stoltei TaxID=1481888 RepID=A0AAU9ISV1_9CILI|nr:unnamed protein product [Blepharisma stoltei]